MNKLEAAKVLAVAAGFDNRRPDELATAAWMELLSGYNYEQCRQAILDHYRDPETRHKYLTAAHVLDRVEQHARAKSQDVEADVRSAKARGLISADWPKRQSLPDDIASKLSYVRELERIEARKLNEIDRDDDA